MAAYFAHIGSNTWPPEQVIVLSEGSTVAPAFILPAGQPGKFVINLKDGSVSGENHVRQAPDNAFVIHADTRGRLIFSIVGETATVKYITQPIFIEQQGTIAFVVFTDEDGIIKAYINDHILLSYEEAGETPYILRPTRRSYPLKATQIAGYFTVASKGKMP